MADIVSRKKRSKMMANIKGQNTKPEILIRKSLFKLGYRYTLHNRKLPSKPDIYLAKYQVVILVNGCFWHVHDCHLFKLPKTRTEFWQEKLSKNISRDLLNFDKLRKLGFRVAIVWECSLKGKFKLELEDIVNRLDDFIKSDEETICITGQDQGCETKFI
ncbi:very short patch repair endonuclease [Lewinellaceae bacterium SD302]|nr:very short patch repair endonuclease [Lewinellaceae bacterium SD302]